MSLLRVLVIENDSDHAWLLREALTLAAPGCVNVTDCRALCDAQTHVADGAFDAVITDLATSDNGDDATVQSIRDRFPNVPLLVLATTADEMTMMAGMAAGADEYLLKEQLDGEVLLRTVRHAVARKEAQLHAHQAQESRVALSAMERMLAVVGHELRAPLAAIRLNADFVTQAENALNHAEMQCLDMIQSEAERLVKLVNDLLEAARLDSGKAKWKREAFDVIDVCRRAIDIVTPLADHDDGAVRLRFDPPVDSIRMVGDGGAIQRALINLLTNAIKHTPGGYVRLGCEANDQIIRIEVADTGRGMSQEVMEQLGRPFALNGGMIDVGDISGAGLGLSICKGIAEAHGGQLHVDSTPGVGSTFTLELQAHGEIELNSERDSTQPSKI